MTSTTGTNARPVSLAAAAADTFASRIGVTEPARDLRGVYVTRETQAALAAAYLAAPAYSEAAVAAFAAFRTEIEAQWRFLTEEAGITVEVTGRDPYDSAAAMFADLATNRRIRVLGTSATGAHPFLTNAENDKFRAVHDVLGHAATGRGFDRHGEEAAYQAHARLFSPLARQALATETRGQNAAMIISGGTFAAQKVATLPAVMTATGFALGSEASRTAAAEQARSMHAAAFPPEVRGVAVTYGRNVRGVPMTEAAWERLAADVSAALLASPLAGEAVWTVATSVPTHRSTYASTTDAAEAAEEALAVTADVLAARLAEVRGALAVLAARYGQESAAFLAGNAWELLPAAKGVATVADLLPVVSTAEADAAARADRLAVALAEWRNS